MVMYVLAVALLPLALAGSVMYPQQMQQQQMFNQQKNWGWGVQMQGVMQPQMQQMQGQQQGMQQVQTTDGNKWWTMNNQEEYEAYLKWCEERKLALQEQEEQQQILMEIQERAREQERAHERMKAAKEMEMKRESMAAQWKMWKSQLEVSDEFDGIMEQFHEMKMHFSFKLTMEFLKFCKCTDYASHLQRYLVYGKESYTPTVTDAFALEGLEGIDSTDVEAVARRAASMSAADQSKYFFGGAIGSMCDGVKAYVDQVMAWEQQYNFI